MGGIAGLAERGAGLHANVVAGHAAAERRIGHGAAGVVDGIGTHADADGGRVADGLVGAGQAKRVIEGIHPGEARRRRVRVGAVGVHAHGAAVGRTGGPGEGRAHRERVVAGGVARYGLTREGAVGVVHRVEHGDRDGGEAAHGRGIGAAAVVGEGVDAGEPCIGCVAERACGRIQRQRTVRHVGDHRIGRRDTDGRCGVVGADVAAHGLASRSGIGVVDGRQRHRVRGHRHPVALGRGRVSDRQVVQFEVAAFDLDAAEGRRGVGEDQVDVGVGFTRVATGRIGVAEKACLRIGATTYGRYGTGTTQQRIDIRCGEPDQLDSVLVVERDDVRSVARRPPEAEVLVTRRHCHVDRAGMHPEVVPGTPRAAVDPGCVVASGGSRVIPDVPGATGADGSRTALKGFYERARHDGVLHRRRGQVDLEILSIRARGRKPRAGHNKRRQGSAYKPLQKSPELHFPHSSIWLAVHAETRTGNFL